jgi:HprK-related kinase B
MKSPGHSAVHVRFGDVGVQVSLADAALRDRLSAYFRPFVSQNGVAREPDLVVRASHESQTPEPPGLRPWDGRGKESFADRGGRRVIRKDRTGVVIAGRGALWTIRGDLRRNFNQLVNLVCTVYGMSILDRGGAMIHASAAVLDGRAVAIAGQSGSGKSSVAVRLLERGFDFLTNDRLIMVPQRGGLVGYGLPKLPRINPGTLLAGSKTRDLVTAEKRRTYERMPREELWRLEEKHDLDVQATLGRRWVLSAPLDVIYVLKRDPGQPARVTRLNAGQAVEALRAVAKSFGAFDVGLPTRSDAALLRAAAISPVDSVSGDIDPAALADHIAMRART